MVLHRVIRGGEPQSPAETLGVLTGSTVVNGSRVLPGSTVVNGSRVLPGSTVVNGSRVLPGSTVLPAAYRKSTFPLGSAPLRRHGRHGSLPGPAVERGFGGTPAE